MTDDVPSGISSGAEVAPSLESGTKPVSPKPDEEPESVAGDTELLALRPRFPAEVPTPVAKGATTPLAASGSDLGGGVRKEGATAEVDVFVVISEAKSEARDEA